VGMDACVARRETNARNHWAGNISSVAFDTASVTDVRRTIQSLVKQTKKTTARRLLRRAAPTEKGTADRPRETCFRGGSSSRRYSWDSIFLLLLLCEDVFRTGDFICALEIRQDPVGDVIKPDLSQH
jgi:hypothetical protein